MISTRADPPLPLARLRARGELAEVRAADLRFTLDEVDRYLNEATGLPLTAGDVAALEERTEGWVAALQLAAFSLRGRDDPSGFIAGFAGDDRFVVDYLVEEVLDRQPEQVRRFLLATSILDRLSGPLCDAVTGSPAAARCWSSWTGRTCSWSRWTTSGAGTATTTCSATCSALASPTSARTSQTCTARASNWHDQNGDPVAAVRHALAAGDVERAADLVELAVPELRRQRQEGTLRHWVDQLPTSVVDRRPVLAMGFVGALMSSNEFDDVERRLGVIEKALDRGQDLVVVDETRARPTARRHRAVPGRAGAPWWRPDRHPGACSARGRARTRRRRLDPGVGGRPGRARGVDDRRPRVRTQQLHRRRGRSSPPRVHR